MLHTQGDVFQAFVSHKLKRKQQRSREMIQVHINDFNSGKKYLPSYWVGAKETAIFEIIFNLLNRNHFCTNLIEKQILKCDFPATKVS